MFVLLNFFKKKHYYSKQFLPKYSGYNLLIAEEIDRIRESLKQHISPPQPDLIEHSNSRLVWKISFKDKEDQFMKFDRPNYISDDSYLVYADTELLYLLLLNHALISNNNSYYSCKLRKDLPKDSKYKYAEDCFLKSINSPIPLADIYMEIVENKPFVSFSDGITRTIWLIANYALSLPVYTSSIDSANHLNNLVGLTDEPISVRQIFKE